MNIGLTYLITCLFFQYSKVNGSIREHCIGKRHDAGSLKNLIEKYRMIVDDNNINIEISMLISIK